MYRMSSSFLVVPRVLLCPPFAFYSSSYTWKRDRARSLPLPEGSMSDCIQQAVRQGIDTNNKKLPPQKVQSFESWHVKLCRREWTTNVDERFPSSFFCHGYSTTPTPISCNFAWLLLLAVAEKLLQQLNSEGILVREAAASALDGEICTDHLELIGGEFPRDVKGVSR